jgi:hypothetical protein
MLPVEIRERIIAFSVTEETIKIIWTHFPTIKWYISDTNLNWEEVSIRQTLSEEFIRDFSDRVDWYSIFIRQKLSEDFIREHSSRVHRSFISFLFSGGFLNSNITSIP